MSYLSLRDYGLIGNQASAILISRLGSVDWCCLPYFDSPSHFGALLDENQGGAFQIAPIGDFKSEQSYVERSNVLETLFETPNGRGILTDWMPIEGDFTREPIHYRQVQVLDGEIRWALNCVPRFSYGNEGAQAEHYGTGILFRGHEATDIGILHGTVPLSISSRGRSAQAEFLLSVGQQARFSWIWGRHGKFRDFPSPETTVEQWRTEAHQCDPAGCVFAGPWHDNVVRSGLALKLMTAHYAGSIIEAVTTSLPTLTGGARNWDYRYAWIRNSALAYQALSNLGYGAEADELFSWLADIVSRDGAEALQSVYTLDGGKYLPEQELAFLSGYAGSRPVRIGNLSARQFQLDIYGHVIMAAAHYHQVTGKLPARLWPKLAEIADACCQAWRRPDRGPWEVRSKPEHFVASKVMCWVALDRAIALAEKLGEEAPPRWRDEAQILHRTICDQGYDSTKRAFTRAFGTRELDASALLIPLVGFLPFEDERVQTTMDAVQAELSEGVFVHRYRSSEGLPETDGGHLLCSLWLISCLALSGRVEEASDRLAELCSYATKTGLFGEQVDPSSGEPAGNFPSSAAHLALINASLYIGIARTKRVLGTPVIGLALRPGRRARPSKAA